MTEEHNGFGMTALEHTLGLPEATVARQCCQLDMLTHAAKRVPKQTKAVLVDHDLALLFEADVPVAGRGGGGGSHRGTLGSTAGMQRV